MQIPFGQRDDLDRILRGLGIFGAPDAPPVRIVVLAVEAQHVQTRKELGDRLCYLDLNSGVEAVRPELQQAERGEFVQG